MTSFGGLVLAERMGGRLGLWRAMGGMLPKRRGQYDWPTVIKALSDLGLHHPPCQSHRRNSGFYALGGLALTLGAAVDAIGGQSSARGNRTRRDGGRRARPTPRRMRLWRLRRELFALPGRVGRHARELTVRLLGLNEATQQ